MKTYTVLISFFVCLNLNAQKGRLILSRWHENGNGNEDINVSSDKYTYYEKGKLYYFLSNDNANVYIDMKFTDPEVQNRILNEGLTIWINMESKPSKKLGVRYPIGSQNTGSHSKPKLPDVNIKADGSHVPAVSLSNTIELIGFTSEEARRFPADNADNFRGSVKVGIEGVLHYRLIMPIAKLPVRNSKDGHGAMPFNFGIEYGPLIAKPSLPTVLFWIKNIKLATDK
jgi:hypothetical protein